MKSELFILKRIKTGGSKIKTLGYYMSKSDLIADVSEYAMNEKDGDPLTHHQGNFLRQFGFTNNRKMNYFIQTKVLNLSDEVLVYKGKANIYDSMQKSFPVSELSNVIITNVAPSKFTYLEKDLER